MNENWEMNDKKSTTEKSRNDMQISHTRSGYEYVVTRPKGALNEPRQTSRWGFEFQCSQTIIASKQKQKR